MYSNTHTFVRYVYNVATRRAEPQGEYPLTKDAKIDYSLSMAGKIRTKEKCPKCNGNFKGSPLRCSTCLTTPEKCFIDIFWKKRIKIYSTRDGIPLDSWARASRLLESIRGEIDRKVFDPEDYLPDRKTRFSFETKINEWLREKEIRKERGDLAPSYLEKLEGYVKSRYIPFFRITDIREIRTGDIEKFYQDLPRKLSSKTVKNILDALRNFFFEMQRKEFTRRCPQFPKISPPEPEWRWIDVGTQNSLIKAIPEKHRPIFLFMARQAVRPGEARALHWEDIDFDRETVTIRRSFSLNELRNFTKSKRIRHLPLHPEVLDVLKQHRGLSGLVFRCNAKSYSKETLFYWWKKAKDAVGIKTPLRLYDGTRHSVASQAVNRGVDLNLIGKVLGHSQSAMTNRYAHVMTDVLKKVIISSEASEDSKEGTYGRVSVIKKKDQS